MISIYYRDLTVPNIMTLLRILMAFLAIAIFFLLHNEVLAAALCIIASLLDYFDGWYARRFRQTTRLGAHLDPFADKVLIATVFLIISLTLKLFWFYIFIVVIMLREVVITVYRMIKRRRMGVFIPASKLGKIKTTVQCIAGDSMLFYFFIYPKSIPENMVPVFVIMAITLFITVDSGLQHLLPNCSDGKKRSVLERIFQQIFGYKAREA